MHTTELTLDQAIAYRDFVRGRHDERLRELAWWMSRTGGPVDAMDGSLPSLDELTHWAAWFVGIDMPSLPQNPELLVSAPWEDLITNENYPPDWTVASVPDDRRSRRKRYLDESLTHYLLEVVRRLDSSAEWDVCPEKKNRVGTVDVHATGIRSRERWRAVAYRWMWFWRDRDAKGAIASEFFASYLALPPEPLLAMRATSVLTRYLDREPVAPFAPPRFQLPAALGQNQGSPRFYGCAGTALDPTLVCRALHATGFRNRGGDILESDLVQDHRFLHLDGRLEATVVTNSGQISAIVIIPWESPEWHQLSVEVCLLRATTELTLTRDTPQLLTAVGVSEAVKSTREASFEDMAFAFAISPRNIERQHKWKPLPVAAVVAALADLEVHGTDGSISAADLVDGAHLARHDDVLTAMVAGAGGKPRALWFEVHNMRPDEWDTFYARMTQLATATGARFCAEAELFGDNDDDD